MLQQRFCAQFWKNNKVLKDHISFVKAWEKVIWHIVSRGSNHVVGHKFQCQTYMSAWYKVSYYDAVIQIIYVVLFNVIDNIYFIFYVHKENSA